MRPLGRIDALAFAVCWAPYTLLVRRFWFVCDDAFISFRYARNWALGHGVRYNLGTDPPVEGYSNFLWVGWCALIERLGGDVTVWAPAAAYVCGSVLLYSVFSLLRRRWDSPLPVVCMGTLALGCFPPFALWSTGGLETMPAALLLFTAFDRLILRGNDPKPLAAGLAGLGLALIRTEGIAWAMLIGGLAWLAGRLGSRRTGRALLTYFAVLCVGFGVYYAWRYSYYQTPLANSAYAKAGFSLTMADRGLKYVATFILTFLSPVVFLAGVAAAFRTLERSVALPLIGIALADLAYAIVVGGDFMAMGRILVPGFVVFNALLFAALLQVCWRSSTRGRIATTALALVVVALAILPAWNVHLVPGSVRQRCHFRLNQVRMQSEFAQWRFMRSNTDVWKQTGLGLRNWAEPGDSCVLLAIGAAGYYSDLHVYDRCGLVTPKVTRRDTEGETSFSPGHDKLVPEDFFLDDAPTFVLPSTHPVGPRQIVAYARQLRSGRMSADYAVDFFAIRHPTTGSPAGYMVVYRRYDNAADRKAAWNRCRARLQSMRR